MYVYVFIDILATKQMNERLKFLSKNNRNYTTATAILIRKLKSKTKMITKLKQLN